MRQLAPLGAVFIVCLDAYVNPFCIFNFFCHRLLIFGNRSRGLEFHGFAVGLSFGINNFFCNFLIMAFVPPQRILLSKFIKASRSNSARFVIFLASDQTGCQIKTMHCRPLVAFYSTFPSKIFLQLHQQSNLWPTSA